MNMTLHYHPLASFCHKALVALYELDLPFEKVIVDFGDPASADAFRRIWPMAKMPVLVEGARIVAESSLVVEHANRIAGGALVPADADAALSVRFWDRFFDHYLADAEDRARQSATRGRSRSVRRCAGRA